ncbi:MAG: cytochrome c maturation protein CcmE [Azospirillaceae bacterium]
MTRKRRRLAIVGLCALGLGTATALALTAFEDNILFFYSPTEIAERQVEPGQRFRLGGLVADGSVVQLDDSAGVAFTVTNTVHDVDVRYEGILPDLFREGQGVVAHGILGGDGVFVADEVLARHDETYMPPEVAEALEAAGHGPLTAPQASGNRAVVPQGGDSVVTQ